MNNISLGEKIKNYRKRAGLSQLQLETEIDASQGSISRIESGKVNPTKESVLKIGRALRVSTQELNDLLEIRPLFPAEEEIQDAIAEVKDYLDSEDVIAYLIDEFANYYAVSKGFVKFLDLSHQQIESFNGRNILEIISEPQFGIIQKLDPEHVSHTLSIEIARIVREQGSDAVGLFAPLRQKPELNVLWEQSEELSDAEVYSPKNKIAHFILDGKKLQMAYSRERLKRNERFELIEFYTITNL